MKLVWELTLGQVKRLAQELNKLDLDVDEFFELSSLKDDLKRFLLSQN